MCVFSEFAKRVKANAIPDARTMVAIYTVFCLAILAGRTWILASQDSNRLYLILVDLVIVGKRADVLLRAGPPEVVIIA